MKWAETQLEEGNLVNLRPSDPADLNLETQLDVLCFGFLEHEAGPYNRSLKEKQIRILSSLNIRGNLLGNCVSRILQEKRGFMALPFCPTIREKVLGETR